MAYFPLQPRDTCYVASAGVTELVYSGYKPHAYSWECFPPLKEILEAVRILTFNMSKKKTKKNKEKEHFCSFGIVVTISQYIHL